MSFVVDGSEWDFDGWAEDDLIRSIEKLVDRVWIAQSRKEVVWIGDDLQTRHVLGDHDLWGLLAPDSPIKLPPELGQELAAWLGSAPRYLDEEPWPDWILEVQVSVDRSPSMENCDVAWAHHNVRTGRPVACMGLKRSGVYDTKSNLGSVVVHWVSDEITHRIFWRSAISSGFASLQVLESYAEHAYPDLYFVPGVLGHAGSFGGGFHASRPELLRYLEVLNDYGAWAFTCAPPALTMEEPAGPDPTSKPTNQIIERRFRGLKLDMAPENPNVRLNKNCREAREILLAQKIFYCEWHGKLEPHRNRIHVHPPVPQSKGKVVIAILHEHLPLPG